MPRIFAGLLLAYPLLLLAQNLHLEKDTLIPNGDNVYFSKVEVPYYNSDGKLKYKTWDFEIGFAYDLEKGKITSCNILSQEKSPKPIKPFEAKAGLYYMTSKLNCHFEVAGPIQMSGGRQGYQIFYSDTSDAGVSNCAFAGLEFSQGPIEGHPTQNLIEQGGCTFEDDTRAYGTVVSTETASWGFNDGELFYATDSGGSLALTSLYLGGNGACKPEEGIILAPIDESQT